MVCGSPGVVLPVKALLGLHNRGVSTLPRTIKFLAVAIPSWQSAKQQNMREVAAFALAPRTCGGRVKICTRRNGSGRKRETYIQEDLVALRATMHVSSPIGRREMHVKTIFSFTKYRRISQRIYEGSMKENITYTTREGGHDGVSWMDSCQSDSV